MQEQIVVADFQKLEGKKLEQAYFEQRRPVRKELQKILTPGQKASLEPKIYARRGISKRVDGHLIFTDEAKQERLERLKEKVGILQERIKTINAEIKQLEKGE